jgi:uncharacterized protein YbaR (Trm112 family)/SAM-dependent methyltransferase
VDPALLDVCVCPKCRGPLRDDGDGVACPACRITFASVQGIPCLSTQASAWLADWRRQAGVYQQLLARGAELMEQQLGAPDLLPATRQRVSELKAAAADNGGRVLELLRAAGITADPPRGEPSEAGFNLIEYYDHLLRDWAWDEESEENARSRDLVLEALGDDRRLGRVVVLGAGGCRLAYDLHMRCKPELTVALDLSPLFLVVAKRVMFGNGLRLYEFPAVPRDAGAVCVERDLRAPAGSPSRFHLLLADAFAAPLRAGAFDTVLTPWFIDIVPVDVRDTLGVVWKLLAPGGRWINYGPLNYPKDRPHAQRYTPEELFTLVRLAGFELGPTKEAEIELLGSRAAANGRSERVLTFTARKPDAVPASVGEAPADPPVWLLFSHLPVPRFPGLDAYVPDHPVVATVARAIDGSATIADIAERLVSEHGARPDAAVAGTRALLSLVYQSCLAPGG